METEIMLVILPQRVKRGHILIWTRMGAERRKHILISVWLSTAKTITHGSIREKTDGKLWTMALLSTILYGEAILLVSDSFTMYGELCGSKMKRMV